jgi:hypothetical protein
MDLIDRYLGALRILLPRAQRDDIIAELRDVLTGCREEESAKLSRSLNQDEEEALLREFGHPVLVAARYRPQQYLIGPDLYPVYAFVLKLVLIVVAAAAVLVGFMSTFAANDTAALATANAIGVAWHGILGAVGTTTICFAILQRYFPRLRLFSHWRARDLPAVGRTRRAAWFDDVAGMVANVLFLLVWTQAIDVSGMFAFGPNHLHFGLAPVWQDLYWPFIALALAGIVVHGFRLVQNANSRLATILDLVLQGGIVTTAILALRAGHWIVVSGQGIAEGGIEQLESGVNMASQVGLAVVVCIALFRAGYELWRLAASD